MYYVVDQSKQCAQIYLQTIACCLLQLPILYSVESIISDMHHRITYMYINIHPSRVSKSVKTVRTNIFSKKCKLHKFETTNNIFF